MSTPESTADNSYDRVPYPSWPFAQSHPDRIASIALLLGLDPPPVATAAVLELGCASGGNLIPMAEMYPKGHFVGIDMSGREIEDGQHRIASLGLTNIELHQQDIMEFPLDGSPFDYIIAHGVFSWVPRPVQDQIFAISQHRLSDRGLAYISYNTFPGWRMRGMIRDMVTYHASQFHEPEKQIYQARALLQFLAESVSTDTPYGAFLKQELGIFQRVADEYVFHDHLEGVNEPVYFHEFMSRANQFGLQYVGEPNLKDMATSRFSAEVEETLHRISKDIVQVEQYMDFLKNRTFRQTLLCKEHHTVDRSLAPTHAGRLSFASPLQRVDEQDEHGNSVIAFHHKGVRVTSDRQSLVLALELLGKSWPHWIAFEEIVEYCQKNSDSRMSEQLAGIDLASDVAQHLVRCYASGVATIHATSPQFVRTISDRPLVASLVRQQAMLEHRVTNRRHEVVKLNDIAQRIVRLLDGKHSFDMIQSEIKRQIQSGELEFTVDGEQIPEEQLDAKCHQVLQSTLAHLCDASLLVA